MNLVSNYLEKNILSNTVKLMAFNQECGWNNGSKSSHSFWATLYSASLLSVKNWMEGTYDMPYKNSYFFVPTLLTKSDGVFCRNEDS